MEKSFLFLLLNISCDPSLELSQQDVLTKGHSIFFMTNIKNIPVSSCLA